MVKTINNGKKVKVSVKGSMFDCGHQIIETTESMLISLQRSETDPQFVLDTAIFLQETVNRWMAANYGAESVEQRREKIREHIAKEDEKA